MWQTYHSASSMEDAVSLLAEHAGQAKIIAGGTDLIIEMERGQRPEIEALIDISRLPGLDQI